MVKKKMRGSTLQKVITWNAVLKISGTGIIKKKREVSKLSLHWLHYTTGRRQLLLEKSKDFSYTAYSGSCFLRYKTWGKRTLSYFSSLMSFSVIISWGPENAKWTLSLGSRELMHTLGQTAPQATPKHFQWGVDPLKKTN